MSATPSLSLPRTIRTMYLASPGVASFSRPTSRFILACWEPEPVA